MTRLRTLALAIVLSCTCLTVAHAISATENVLVELAALDPASQASLGNEERLSVLVRFESDIPLRFQAIGMHNGSTLEVGAQRSPAALHEPGKGEALAWVIYENPTYVDAVRVTVLDEEWRKLYTLVQPVDLHWLGVPVAQPRQPAEWVENLDKAERRKKDFVYDPAPRKYGVLYDVFFYLTLAAIPVYILLQLHMLWHYRYRWRELAFIPLFPYLIIGFYALVGLPIETSLQVTFLFRYTPCALLYLVCLWVAKRFWQHKLPPPKLYKPPKV